jgi:hypothetical protein
LSIAQHTNKEEQKQKRRRISLPRWCLPQNTLKSLLFALKRKTKKFNKRRSLTGWHWQQNT